MYCAAFLVGAVATMIFLPRKPNGFVAATPSELAQVNDASDSNAASPPPDAASGAQVMDPWIWRLALFAFLMGSAGGAIGRFFALWAEEAIGLTTTRAGLLVALTGVIGIVARIAAGRVAERLIAPPRLLRILAAIGASYALILIATPILGSWLLWPGTVFNAVGIGAWNAVAMLAIITVVPKVLAGRASGIVMLGFLGGLSIGSPIAGWVVDRWGSYQPVWTACLILAVLAMMSLAGGSSQVEETPGVEAV